MAVSYRLNRSVPGAQQLITRLPDGADIPVSHSNRDYRAYLAWLAQGNTPDPAPSSNASPVLTAYDYFLRFRADETAAIQTFALTNPPTADSIKVFNYLLLSAAKGNLDLTHQIVRDGHALLVSLGLITQARSTAILTP